MRDEWLDHVDENDNVLERVLRSESNARGLRHRIVAVMIKNSAGEYAVTVRSARKAVYPNTYSTSVAETLEAGEVYLDAAVRGLQEEVSVTVNPEDLTEIGLMQVDGKFPRNCMVYTLEFSGELKGWEEEADALYYWRSDRIEQILEEEADKFAPVSYAIFKQLVEKEKT